MFFFYVEILQSLNEQFFVVEDNKKDSILNTKSSIIKTKESIIKTKESINQTKQSILRTKRNRQSISVQNDNSMILFYMIFILVIINNEFI